MLAILVPVLVLVKMVTVLVMTVAVILVFITMAVLLVKLIRVGNDGVVEVGGDVSVGDEGGISVTVVAQYGLMINAVISTEIDGNGRGWVWVTMDNHGGTDAGAGISGHSGSVGGGGSAHCVAGNDHRVRFLAPRMVGWDLGEKRFLRRLPLGLCQVLGRTSTFQWCMG